MKYIKNFESLHYGEKELSISEVSRYHIDKELPIPINTRIKVPNGILHRIIKGTGNLQLIIEMNKDI